MLPLHAFYWLLVTMNLHGHYGVDHVDLCVCMVSSCLLVDVAKALVLPTCSKVTSQEATVDVVQFLSVEEAFLAGCLC